MHLYAQQDDQSWFQQEDKEYATMLVSIFTIILSSGGKWTLTRIGHKYTRKRKEKGREGIRGFA
jgi:hypothetical protein